MIERDQAETARLYKLGAFDEVGALRAHLYQKQFFVNDSEAVPVVQAVTDESPLNLLLDLSGVFPDPFLVLYDLISPQSGWAEGSYVWNEELSKAGLIDLLAPKVAFLENDARHRIGCHSTSAQVTIVLDEHNVIKCLPANQQVILRLRALGYLEQEFEVPFPHSHPYHESFNNIEEEWLDDERWVIMDPEDLSSSGHFH